TFAVTHPMEEYRFLDHLGITNVQLETLPASQGPPNHINPPGVKPPTLYLHIEEPPPYCLPANLIT
ncbi:Hypothetical predicted protein, partial [Pelobates cultripes]